MKLIEIRKRSQTNETNCRNHSLYFDRAWYGSHTNCLYVVITQIQKKYCFLPQYYNVRNVIYMKLINYYQDPNILHVGTMPNRAYYIPFKHPELTTYGNRLLSERLLMLNGNWEFHYYPSIYQVPENFFAEDFVDENPDTIPVPSCWQIHGYDRHQYTNIAYPFPFDPPYVPDQNPCATYLVDFYRDETESQMSSFLNFEGVDSCFYVWINGEMVGYSQVSHSTSEFDITPFIREGQNHLAVLVLKWCDGSYLEDQDKLRMSGIFRDVYILTRPKEHIRDYFIKTTLDDNYQNAQITVDFEWFNQPVPVECDLYSPSGELLETKKTNNNWILFSVDNALLWNAEQPNLYQLIIRTPDESISQYIGIRKVEIRNSVLYFNGVNIKIKGVNRHDSDPYTGYTISEKQLIKDLELMKRHNINAIRTSHYPNAPWATQLYDQYGFYVIDEADVEIHGTTTIYGGGSDNWSEEDYTILNDHTFGMLAHDPRFEQAILDRTQRNVIRDKNCASVFMWSLGNESGYGPNFEKAAAWIKQYDPSRLVHYESSINQMKGYQNDLSNLDVYSRMYADIPFGERYCNDDTHQKPFIQCEFVHAMGNGPGDIENYFEQIYQYDKYAGGFVWEWCDHGVYLGRTPEGKNKFGYGGDFGEFPHDGNFCMDGLVYPDRTPHTGLMELKQVVRPVRATAVHVQTGQIRFDNKLDFTNLKDYLYITYDVVRDGKIIYNDRIDDLDIPPHQNKTITLTYRIPETGNVQLNLYYYTKHETSLVGSSHLLGHDQIILRKQSISIPTAPKQTLTVNESDCAIEIFGEQFRYVFNKLTGNFDSLVKDGINLLSKPMEYNIWRAPTDNDREIRIEWQKAGYDRMTVKVYQVSVKQRSDQVVITADLSLSAVFIQRILTIKATWTIHSDGHISADLHVNRNTELPFLPRFGLRLFLPKQFDQVTYTGYGPYESYIDKHRASIFGTFTSKVCNLHEDYIKPQENGSHWGCKSVCISNPFAYTIAAFGEHFSFNASEYTQEELSSKMHNYELTPCEDTVLCLDYQQSGIGSNSCGPALLKPYRLDADTFDYHIDLVGYYER